MSNELSATNGSYTKLIFSIDAKMTSGLVAAQKALEYQRLKTYWSIGRIINAYLAKNSEAAKIGNAFLKQVAEDLNRHTELSIAHDTLTRAVQFHRHYSTFPAKTSLTFSHYLVLMRVHDLKERARLEKRAIKESMSVTDMKREVSLLTFTPQGASTARLTVERGEPFIYALKAGENISGKRIVRIDCGFKILKSLPDLSDKFSKSGSIVRSIKSGDGYALSLMQKLSCKRYTYPAVVTNVVDGDTIDACVEVGFGIWINERFRLRGVNTPEMNTSEGVRAKVFVERFFKECPQVIIRSMKAGMYGRWLADIFSLKNETDPHIIAKQGDYLNQILLDKGIAEKY